MLKHQPVDAIENWTVAMIFVASHGILRLGKTGFDDLRADMPEPALDGFVRKLKARFSELCIEWTVDQCREMLIDLANGEIKRLKSKSARHMKRAARRRERGRQAGGGHQPQSREPETARAEVHEYHQTVDGAVSDGTEG